MPLMCRVRNREVRVRENLLISFFHSAWTGEGQRKNNSKFTDPNHPTSDSAYVFSPTLHALFCHKVERVKELLHSALTQVATPKLVINPHKRAPTTAQTKAWPKFQPYLSLVSQKGKRSQCTNMKWQGWSKWNFKMTKSINTESQYTNGVGSGLRE